MLKNKWIKFGLKLLVSLFFIWWIIFKINWNEVQFYLKELSFGEISIYILFYVVGMVFSSYKWKFLAKCKGIVLPLGVFLKYYFTATFINNFMPSFVGGDSFKIYQIGKISGKFKEAASSVVMDRITGLWGGMMIMIIFSVLNFNIVIQNKILLISNILALCGLMGSFVFLEFYKKRELRTPFVKINKIFNKITSEINHYNGEARDIWKAIGLSFLFNLVGLAGANYILFSALNIDIGILNYLSVIFLVSVISSIPISINNIGVKEWAYITFFGIFGISAGAVVSVAIISRIIQMLLSFLALPAYLREKE